MLSLANSRVLSLEQDVEVARAAQRDMEILLQKLDEITELRNISNFLSPPSKPQQDTPPISQGRYCLSLY